MATDQGGRANSPLNVEDSVSLGMFVCSVGDNLYKYFPEIVNICCGRNGGDSANCDRAYLNQAEER